MPRGSKKKIIESDDESDISIESDHESINEEIEDIEDDVVSDEEVEEVDDEEVEEVEEVDEVDDDIDDGEGYSGKKKDFKFKQGNTLIIDDDDIIPEYQTGEVIIPDDERMSDPVLYYYEMVAIIGTRAQQLANSAPPMIKINAKDVFTIALAELRERVIPYKIKRYLPGNRVEIFRLSELKFIYPIPTELT